MKSLAMILDLIDAPKTIAKYKAYRREAWPEVASGLRSVGNAARFYKI